MTSSWDGIRYMPMTVTGQGVGYVYPVKRTACLTWAFRCFCSSREAMTPFHDRRETKKHTLKEVRAGFSS